MAKTYSNRIHVFGPALFFFAEANSSAWSRVGITEEGMQVTITPFFEPIFTDRRGSSTPEDYRFLGIMGQLTGTLITYNVSDIRRFETGFTATWANNAKNSGANRKKRIGSLVVPTNNHFQAALMPVKRTGQASGTTNFWLEEPRYFPRCLFDHPLTESEGTRASRHRLTMTMFPNEDGEVEVAQLPSALVSEYTSGL